MSGISAAGGDSDWPATPVHVVIRGEAISEHDIVEMVSAMVSSPVEPELRIKSAEAMPRDAPLWDYAGKNASGVPVLQVDKTCYPRSDTNSQACVDAYAAALALMALDGGGSGTVWHDIYAKTPANRAARLALASDIANGLKAASDQAAARARAQASWIHEHVPAGITKGEATKLLAKHLVGESTHELYVNLYGAFNVGCQATTSVTIEFGPDDRATKVSVDEPKWDCG